MHIFYAFCRMVDDLADEPHFTSRQRKEGLEAWRVALARMHAVPGEPGLAPLVRQVLARHGVPLEWAQEIVAGCEMDLGRVRYNSWRELKLYCYRVASAVGLVSARIFGAVGCENYAEDLGLALQLTNILRDSAEDYRNGDRVYLPLEELKTFGVEEGAWERGEPRGWSALMRMQTERARGYYAMACRALPPSESNRMVAAEIMRAVYAKLLDRMESDGFRVWSTRYRLSAFQKLSTVTGAFLEVMCAHLPGWGRNSARLQSGTGGALVERRWAADCSTTTG
jgi:phytoene synthase